VSRNRSAMASGLLVSGILISMSGAPVSAQVAQKIGAPPEAHNMRLVGSNDLQGRSAYQPTIHHQGDRWIAYIGHHGGTDAVPKPVNPLTGQPEFNGTSILDVTDSAHPSADTAAMLFWALLASGQINMRKVDGWQTLATKPIDQPIDLAA
jgi:hypothetical protein